MRTGLRPGRIRLAACTILAGCALQSCAARAQAAAREAGAPSHGDPPVVLRLESRSGACGLGDPYPATVADPIQALASRLAFPALLAPDSARSVARAVPSAGWRTWTIHLREGAAWGESGRPLRADDVARSLEDLLDPRTRSPHAILFRHVLGFGSFRAGRAEHLAGLAVLDERRLEILLGEPDPDLPGRLRHPAAGLVRWPRRNPFRPPRGPGGWDPRYGHPAPEGLARVRWTFAVWGPGADLPWCMELAGEPPLRIELRRGRTAPADADGARGGTVVTLQGPDLPGYCGTQASPGREFAAGESLVLLLAHPAHVLDGAPWGLPESSRRSLFLLLAREPQLLARADGVRPAEGFLENPRGYLEGLLRRAWGREAPAQAPEKAREPARAPRAARLFYPSGDPVLECLSRRVEAIASGQMPIRSTGLPERMLHAALRQGAFDLALTPLPLMAPAPWEAAGIALGFLEPELSPAFLRLLEGGRAARWVELPVAAELAEPRARRLEARLLESAGILPLVRMRTRLMAHPDPGDGFLSRWPDLPGMEVAGKR